jgi:hypothetical protein
LKIQTISTKLSPLFLLLGHSSGRSDGLFPLSCRMTQGRKTDTYPTMSSQSDPSFNFKNFLPLPASRAMHNKDGLLLQKPRQRIITFRSLNRVLISQSNKIKQLALLRDW